jgi:hypothetical protein
LFYKTTDDQLMAVSVTASGKGTLDFGLPQSLFQIKGTIVPEGEGQRFLWLLPIGNVSQPPITVIVNWAGQQR